MTVRGHLSHASIPQNSISFNFVTPRVSRHRLRHALPGTPTEGHAAPLLPSDGLGLGHAAFRHSVIDKCCKTCGAHDFVDCEEHARYRCGLKLHTQNTADEPPPAAA